MSKYPDIKDGANVFKYDNFSPELYLGKANVFYGPSKTGKSYLLNEFLKSLAPHVYAAVVFANTANTDKEFPMTEYTPAPLIHTGLDMGKLRLIVKSCSERMEFYRRSRDLVNLKKSANVLKIIYKQNNELTRLKQLNYVLKMIRNYKRKEVDNPTSKKDLIQAEETMVEFYLYLMKKGKSYIRQKGIDLSEFEDIDTISLLFCKLNPNLLLIFNDVGNEVKSLKKEDKTFMETLFTRGRHDGLTIAFLAQSATQLPPDARCNAHNNIFTTSGAVEEYIDTCKMRFMRNQFKSAINAIMAPDDKLPDGQKKFFKIAYSKEQGQIFYVRGDKMGEQKKIGDPKLFKYLKSIEINRIEELLMNVHECT